MVSVISKEEPKDTIPPDSDQFINNLAFQAVVLPFISGTDTYTILNPSVRNYCVIVAGKPVT